jgi:hypothetical protein
MVRCIKLSSFLAITLVATGCANNAERASFQGLDQLPPPKTEYAQRDYPGPALNPVDDGSTVQPSANGFVFLRNNKPISGNVQFSGKVTEVLPGKIVAMESSSVVTSLLYKLSDGLSLPFAVGDQIDVTFTHDKEWVNGFSIEVLQNGKLIYAAARAFGTSPLRAVLSSKMYIRQKDNTPSGFVPVLVGFGNKEVPIDDNGTAMLSMAGVDHRTRVLVSLLRANDNIDASGREGLPYTLEYYTIAATKYMPKGK